jgi:NADPH-dependent glutamate synthase beta subunit-like oxidoreductase
MLHLGSPEYRLPRGLIRYEIGAILELGVELRTNVAVGNDLTLQDLKQQGFEAIFISVGCHKSKDLEIPGRELDGVYSAVDYLLNTNLGYRVELGERTAIIGGGDVAMDVARTAMRSSSKNRTISPALLKELPRFAPQPRLNTIVEWTAPSAGRTSKTLGRWPTTSERRTCTA